MEDFFQKPSPSDAPPASTSAPWSKRIEYKSGKTPAGLVQKTDPEDVNAGFAYYDKERATKVPVPSFTASIVALLSGVTGTVPNGTRYDNYWSSFVQDTRTQSLGVYLGSGDNRVTVASGIYNDFKEQLPEGVNYCKFAVIYVHEWKECVLLQLTAAVENAVKEAIAAETGQSPARINLFNLFELSSKFWAIKFEGAFEKRDRDGNAWSGKGDMFFYPRLRAGVVLADKFPILRELSESTTAYVDAGQKYFNSKAAPDSSQNSRTENARPYNGPIGDEGFPSAAPPEMDLTPPPSDDLPF